MASKNDIFNILNKPVSNPNFNGFDLSSFSPESLKLGQVKPLGYFHTVPKGKYRLSIDELIHTEPFITDPFVRLSKHIEFIFVPYSQLWHGFSQFIGHAQDPQSSYEQGHEYVPNFSLGLMLERIWKVYTGEINYKDMHGFNIAETALSLLDYLGYGAHPLTKMADQVRTSYINTLKTQYQNAWALLAYNKYWNTYLRDTQHTNPLSPKIFNADLCPCTSVETSHMDTYYTDLEMLELVTIKYRKSKKDLFTSSLTSRQFGSVEFAGINVYGSVSVSGSASLSGSTGADHNYGLVSGLEIPSGISDVVLENSGNYVTQSIQEVDTTRRIRHDHSVSGTGTMTGSGDIMGNGYLSVYTLLTAQMMQKWRETVQRAGNRADDRLRALYGVAPKSDAVTAPYIIGSTSYDIRANQVTSTGEGANTKLADIAAKGIGYSERNQFEFNATEFGIILVLTYLLPENNYLAPIDKLNCLIEPFDYYVQQMENLGLDGIQRKHRILVEYNPSTGKYVSALQGMNNDEGFAARYWQYKQKLNLVHLGFEHGQENSKWVPSRISTDPNNIGIGGLNPYYVAPNEYDTVFGTVADWHLDTDQFIGAYNLKCDAVLPMSELGIPRW